jgi:hypothetical protein
MTMGQPPPSTPQKFTSPLMTIGGNSAMNHPLGAQHERLILELLPFNDSATFHEWLQSESVKGSFNEFTRDLLQNSQGQNFPDPNKEQTAKAAEKAIQKKDPRFLLYHPDKSGWTPEDHHVRFIVTVALDNVLTNTWSFKSGGPNSTAKAVYEVLAYLKASLVVNDQHPPGYSQ